MVVEPLQDFYLSECLECGSGLNWPVSDNLNFVCSNCGWIKMGPAPDADSEAYAATRESMRDEIKNEIEYARERELDQWATEEEATNHPFADN